MEKETQVQRVRDALTTSAAYREARAYVQLEAEQAGLDDDTVAAVVDSAMSAWADLKDDDEQWEDLVASVIQGHAMP